MRKICAFFIGLCIIIFLNCQDEDYKVKYDSDKINITYENGMINFQNNLDVPVILDNIQVNKKEIQNFIQYKTSDYTRYKEEIVLTEKEKLNQIIILTSILLPKHSKEIKYQLKKKDILHFEFYPVTYSFLSDNVYFLEKNISDNETKYKLFSDNDIKSLNLTYLDSQTNVNELNGIMAYVREYQLLTDNFKKKDLKVK